MNDLMLDELKFEDGIMDMKLSGENAMVFTNALIEFFEQNGGKNFLTITMEGLGKKYDITITNLDGVDSPAEKIARLEMELNNSWIPVDEKLPTSNGRFEVTIKNSKGKRRVEMCNFSKDAYLHKWGNEKHWSPNVIAWRSRSKPYKEVDNGTM